MRSHPSTSYVHLLAPTPPACARARLFAPAEWPWLPRAQWKGGKQIDSISGAKTQALQDAIEANMQ